LLNYNKALIVGPNYKTRKGGIASVLSLYDTYLGKTFKFRSSIYFQNIYLSILFFPINLICISFKLWTDHSIEIVHLHGSHEGSFIRKYIIFLLSKNIFKKKVIYHIHSSHYHKFFNNSNKFFKSRICNFINHSDALIVLSEEWKDYFNKSFSPKKIFILENIVKNPNYYNDNIVKGKIKLLFLGRIGERKGIFDLVQAIIKNQSLNEIELLIGGDGNVAKLKKMLISNNLQNVKFLGWVKDNEKTQLLKETNIFILPSFDEGLPISILEAMSYKKAIISTNVGGIPRIVKNNVNGFIIDPGDINQIVESINNYMLNPKLLIEHGEKSIELVSDYFAENVVHKLNSIYSDIL
jgi:glycosyltransferase involved in cell wall biosynthesis